MMLFTAIIALRCTAFHDLAQEYDVIALLLHRNAIIVYIVQLALQLRQLMIVGCK